MSASDYHCPPYTAPRALAGTDGERPTILQYASAASHASEVYTRAVDERCDYRTLLVLGATLARRTDELATAIADEASQ